MKRNNKGYVLALVMVVTLILCSIASIIASSSTNNIKNDVVMFAKEQMRFEAEGLLEQYYAQIKQLQGQTIENIPLDELRETVISKLDEISDFSNWYLSLTQSSVDENKIVTKQFVSSEENQRYTLIINPATEKDGNTENDAAFRISTELIYENEPDPIIALDIEIAVSGIEEPEDSSQYKITFGEVRFIDSES